MLLALTMLLTMVMGMVPAAHAETTTGTTGDCTWMYDSATKTLTVAGSGAMADYESRTDVPWNSVMAQIGTVVIGNGVTAIGKNSFTYASALNNLTIAGTVTSIGDNAFKNAGLMTLTIPGSVNIVGANAFAGCMALSDVTYLGMIPPTVGANPFMGTMVTVVKAPAGYGSDLFGDKPVEKPYIVNVTASPAEGGTVTGSGEFAGNTTVTLTATPASDYVFVNWTEGGAEVSTEATLSFSVTGDRALVANFHKHSYEAEYDSESHWSGCACGDKKNVTGHTIGSDWLYDEDAHWKKCTGCAHKQDIEEHDFFDLFCETCEYERPHTCVGTKQDGKPATCKEYGWRDYYLCELCGEYFEDEACTRIIEFPGLWKETDGRIPKAHSYTFVDAEEPVHADGVLKGGVEAHWYCENCKGIFKNDADKTATTKAELAIIVHHVYDDNPTDRTCNICGWHSCILGNKYGKPATCTVDGVKDYWACIDPTCSKKAVLGESTLEWFEDEAALEAWKTGEGRIPAEHSFGDEWLKDASSHWKDCANCDARNEEAAHEYVDSKDMICDICAYERTPAKPNTPSVPSSTPVIEVKTELHYNVLCRKLNVRSGAGTEYAKIGTLTRGEVVHGKDLGNGWIEIEHEGKKAYISAQYVEADDVACIKKVTVLCRKLNVRAGAGTQYAKVGSITRGKTLCVLAESNGWLKVLYDGDIAWVSAVYVA